MKTSIGPKTMLFVHPDLIIGTFDAGGRPNLMAAAWGGICSSNPPCAAISVQKARHTYTNLMDQRAFTINIPSENYVAEADYAGIESGKRTDKFAVTGLTPVRATFVNAPYVEEFPVVLECTVINTIELGVHTQFIGEILDVKVEERMMGDDGKPDILKIRPILYDPSSVSYYGVGPRIAGAFSAGKKFKK